MKIYLVQHGDSVEKEINPERPLSEKGNKDIKRLTQYLSLLRIQVGSSFHSGKLRAKQTATLLTTGITSLNPLQVKAGLEPMDSVLPIANDIAKLQEDVLLVGHLPFMEKLVGKLVVGDENSKLVHFQPGTIVCLEKFDEKWAINWMIRPELLQ